MKLWKLRIGDTDFLLFYTNRKEEQRIELYSAAMADTSGYEVYAQINEENLLCRMVGEEEFMKRRYLEAIRCLAYWYMKLYEKERCSITCLGQLYRLKTVKNLVTLEISHTDGSGAVSQDIRDDLHFHIKGSDNDTTALINSYYEGYQDKKLHRIAIGEDQHGLQLLRYSSRKVYVSAPVHMDFKGNIIN